MPKYQVVLLVILVFIMFGTDTIYSEQGLLDTIRVENLPAGTYDFYLYDSIPDGLYGVYECQNMNK